jgi:3-hydroxyisobutyrate dehydrogenase-like beta-hydroxyacid dehydrogenase
MGYILEGNRKAHEFTLTNALKDLTYLESMANAARVANPVGSAAKNSFSQAVNAGGDGPEDYVPHLVRFVGARNGVNLEP